MPQGAGGAECIGPYTNSEHKQKLDIRGKADAEKDDLNIVNPVVWTRPQLRNLQRNLRLDLRTMPRCDVFEGTKLRNPVM